MQCNVMRCNAMQCKQCDAVGRFLLRAHHDVFRGDGFVGAIRECLYEGIASKGIVLGFLAPVLGSQTRGNLDFFHKARNAGIFLGRRSTQIFLFQSANVVFQDVGSIGEFVLESFDCRVEMVLDEDYDQVVENETWRQGICSDTARAGTREEPCITSKKPCVNAKEPCIAEQEL